MKNGYFRIKDATSVEGKLVLSGDYILPATLEVKGGPHNDPEPPSRIEVPGPFILKWILPPKIGNERAYNNIKAAAEGAGYETVENDDFSYPPRR